MTAGMPALRPYQREAAGAVLRSVLGGGPASISVEFARQGGKNEVSAQVEVMLLLRNVGRAVTAIKCAPTFRPQAQISLQRLRERLADAGLSAWAQSEDGRTVRLGRARQVFLSAEPGSNVVGHTADLLLEVDEAQDVEEEKFDKEFRPMAAAGAAPIVFYGTPWDDACLLERAKQTHLEAQRRDGVRRHFEYDWEAVAEHNPPYGAYVLGERERLGAAHPLFLTQYALKTILGAGRLFGAAQLSLMNGGHAWLEAPLPGDIYVAGLDIAGEAETPSLAGRHDSTVLTIGRVVQPRTTAGFAAGPDRSGAHLRLDGRGPRHGAGRAGVAPGADVAGRQGGGRRDGHRRAGGGVSARRPGSVARRRPKAERGGQIRPGLRADGGREQGRPASAVGHGCAGAGGVPAPGGAMPCRIQAEPDAELLRGGARRPGRHGCDRAHRGDLPSVHSSLQPAEERPFGCSSQVIAKGANCPAASMKP